MQIFQRKFVLLKNVPKKICSGLPPQCFKRRETICVSPPSLYNVNSTALLLARTREIFEGSCSHNTPCISFVETGAMIYLKFWMFLYVTTMSVRAGKESYVNSKCRCNAFIIKVFSTSVQI